MSTYLDIEFSIHRLLADLPRQKREEVVDEVRRVVKTELIGAAMENARMRRQKKTEHRGSAFQSHHKMSTTSS